MSTYRLLSAADHQPDLINKTELSERYLHPDPGDCPWVRTNFVSTLDGAVHGPDGRSGTINTPSDRTVFALMRANADVVLVGAGTARAEGYRAVDLQDWQSALRVQLGLAPYPTLAIASVSCDLPSLLLPVADAAPVLILTSRRSRGTRPEFPDNVEVIEFGDANRLPAREMIMALGDRGLRRVLCEGGPQLVGQLHAARLVDELCLTLSPLVVAGSAGRSAAGPQLTDESFRLDQVIGADDNALLLRYLRA